ncbi:uncharacterized protein LOC107474506 [Arachis duranensis]|uniref:Uncharacterized protein LOC107474506 n=1 Tax=Arachis duranensis TaxID=130453 RepID=A0A6P4CDR4_ARADU|nr:uncharacterized protein LOC107474506 [Arachis duranensis]
MKEKLEGMEQGINPAQGKEPKEREILKLYMPKAPFPQRLRGGEKEKTYSRFLDIFKSLHVNIPFIEALQQMPLYIKCMKELLTKKNPLKCGQTVVMNKECSALIQKDLPTKKKDLRSFHIPCAIGDTMIDRGFCDLGASINLMPMSLKKKLQINELKSTDVIIQLANKTQKQAIGVVKNVLVKVGRYFFPTDFAVLEMEESFHPIILERPFLTTARALIDVEQGELILRIHDEQIIFRVFKPSHESGQENKEPKGKHQEPSLEEVSNKSQAKSPKTSLIEKQEVQVIQPAKKLNEELKPQDSKGEDNENPPNTRISTAPLKGEKRVEKKVPRGWKNKKIPTEDFSLGTR